MEEASTSGQAAQHDYWRDWLDDTIRLRNTTVMVEAIYKNLQFGPFDADRIGKSEEEKLYQLAANEHEYLTMINDYIQMVQNHEMPEEVGGMPAQRGKEPVNALLERHRGLTDRFKNILLGFIERQPITMMTRQQLSLRLHVLRASLILASLLDKLTRILESSPNRPVELNYILEEDYEAKIRVYLEKFSEHGKNICDCPHSITIDVNPGCPNEDKTGTSLANEFRTIFRAFSEVAFSKLSNIKPPQWYKAQGSTSNG